MIEPSRKISTPHYDVVIAGGGILGAALAWESSLRGINVLLLERNDFGSGTSANSLKFIHGGLRYLQSGNLVRAHRSAHEQDLLSRMAPHLVRALPCVVPTERTFARSRNAYAFGLAFYHRIIRWGLPSRSDVSTGYGLLSLEELVQLVPAIDYANASGGAWWEDAQVHDPCRLVLEFIQSARNLGACCLNYKQVTGIEVNEEKLTGIRIRDALLHEEEEIDCGLLIDATGTGLPGVSIDTSAEPGWCKAVNLGLDLEPSSHAFGFDAPGANGDDKRFLFMTPWHGTTTAGTWYFKGSADDTDAMSLGADELDQCLGDINTVLKSPLEKTAVLYANVGYLPTSGWRGSFPADLLDMDEVIDGANHGVRGYLRPLGVKYTTARRFAEDIVADHVSRYYSLSVRKVVSLPGAGFDSLEELTGSLRSRLPHDMPAEILTDLVQRYGSRAEEIVDLMIAEPSSRETVPTTRTTIAEIEFVCEAEQVERATDVILRRTSMGTAGTPPQAAIEFVLDYLSGKFNWDQQRLDAEREEIALWYARLPGVVAHAD